MITLKDAGLRRGERWIFRHVSFKLAEGEVLAILGRNGRGKTTLLRTLLGSLTLTEGERTMPALVGYVPQLQSGGEQHRCLDIVTMGRAGRLGLFGLPGKQDEAAALSALAAVGAECFAGRPFGQLSGGERQVVLLARALATETKVLVLDEPAASLDLANQDLLLGVLMRLRQARGHTIIFTTHHPQHGLFLADRALMMHAGDEVRYGQASAMMTDGELARLYGVPFARHTPGPGRPDVVSPIFGEAALPS
ncbi:ABC transporter ATP-binding protein (plasmid) [Martelella lutilitoris]|uniref:ABC transporter ATP-binding protein n=1 Tax=Martelella lutilitoris TaxID=2583532 RepID=A0A7T7HPE4_9HYPH|nr:MULTISPECIES: ABC transporter ATP-binding protein [Hyphomicrobiales]QRX65041.1 ABC transporter ATP-binding protein [Dysgonomonadaceae bacterium zrk40]QFT02077.1 putative ABC transporter ATP-binding protein [Labrenzia sp. THAF191b]QFT08385.1 putative ABC transporter ATP-binding protein [Labrenzia sp. THAF191a]QFT19925.1 putative ABC transporter ATP-binding protein [Labrenzia sp. THAF187b]QQM32866.1 ABC transporter ATP-binding protein [Martelella lutilitoris]